jgi:hypothetical protein
MAQLARDQLKEQRNQEELRRKDAEEHNDKMLKLQAEQQQAVMDALNSLAKEPPPSSGEYASGVPCESFMLIHSI